jgi:hypothetical protein
VRVAPSIGKFSSQTGLGNQPSLLKNAIRPSPTLKGVVFAVKGQNEICGFQDPISLHTTTQKEKGEAADILTERRAARLIYTSQHCQWHFIPL